MLFSVTSVWPLNWWWHCTCLRLADWAKTQPEKERKKAIEKARKREMLLSGGPKHFFDDSEYMQQLQATGDNMDDALRQGLQVAGSNSRGKRKADTVVDPLPSKRSRAWWVSCCQEPLHVGVGVGGWSTLLLTLWLLHGPLNCPPDCTHCAHTMPCLLTWVTQYMPYLPLVGSTRSNVAMRLLCSNFCLLYYSTMLQILSSYSVNNSNYSLIFLWNHYRNTS